MSDEKKVSETTAPEAATEAPAVPQQQGPDLTVQDLQNLKSIIDVASQRGAFKPNEMMTVGQTYSKLEMFLEAVSKAQPQQGA
jgi:hypothetical protein